MKDTKYYIWIRQYDSDRNVIGEGRSCKGYKRYGNAWNAAKKLYGDRDDIEWDVAPRNPWEDHSSTVLCGLCCASYELPEDAYGFPFNNYAHVSKKIRVKPGRYGIAGERRHHNVCPECADKIIAYIDSLKKGAKT